MQSKIWNLGEVKFCLNQESRPDRWSQAQEEFCRVGLTDVQRFLSIPADQPNQSFCLSQYAMLKAFLATGAKTAILFEDDVVFGNLDYLESAIGELPTDWRDSWDILYLGANITDMVFGIKENPPTRYSEHLWRVERAWTSHAIAYDRKVAEYIVEYYPVHTFNMYDNWLSEKVLQEFECFLVNPMVAFQRPGKSDLWGGIQTDYTGAFEWGNKFMSK